MITVTADELPRFMACNGSRLLPASLPAAVADTKDRDEGIAAHWVAVAVFRNDFTVDELIDRKAPNGVYVTVEMVEFVQVYLDAIVALERGQIASEVETNTSFGTDQFRVNARADHMAYNAETGTLYGDDFKYGWGIVEPQEHWTLIAHAVGYCLTRQITPARIVLTIHQPRPHHPEGKSRSWEITYADLYERYLRIANTLTNPSDQLVTGIGHCGKCHALATCPAARKANMNAIDASEMAYSDEIDNETLAFELNTLRIAQTSLENRLDALEEMAKFRLKAGQVVDGYAVEIQLSNTDWKPGIDVAIMQALTGKNLAKPKLVTPKQAIKAGVSEEVVKSLTERRQTGVKLVRVDANTKAQRLFGKE
ncbi:DUF2800 domain-containing protein [Mesorhizobium sp. M1A.F.Ca.ET.072.01.1.1]|uniref:DUF2800 domain-containing protein n=1 Tax=Mesorhizobium sp. M1A.F.Ca.ET.072.01.1.1 TaxID=2496753 RepID=UPI000FD5EACF|nr:DUF2800 domain-containing protein [Mesorhizobium sp. M1A.F.Ca.ET.072.01.1.1]RUW55630.1 DUF2800 domain-containing protein [Mesorhizobium sp. M1A.F.Ca.ET.072.01.1.1]